MSTQQPEAPSESAPAAAAAAPAASDPATSVVGASDPAKSATAASASATSAQAAPATTAKPATETGKRRRKKSRWGEGEPAEQKTTKSGRARKKSRWGAPSDQMAIPANAALATRGLTPAQTETFLFRVRLEQITQKLANPAAYVDKEDLGPEPAPIYDQEGKRVNTREKRFKDKLIAERQKLLEKALSSNPALRALAPGFQPAKKVSRIDIPTEKYPGYNFIGLIIGPRGNTQKRMEKETKCKISIRGKGSSKKGRPQPDDDQPLHVHIVAPDDEALKKAEAMVKQLLIPVDEEKNVHKAKQLRELALINGTLRNVVKCRLCGHEGHAMKDCPKRQASWQAANVKCQICGSDNHPTVDCPNRAVGANTAQLNDEYASFMKEPGGGGGGASEGTSAERKPPSQPADEKPGGSRETYGSGARGGGGGATYGQSVGAGGPSRGGPPMGGPPRGPPNPYPNMRGPPPQMYGQRGGYPPPMYPGYGGYQMPPQPYGYGYPPPAYGAPPAGYSPYYASQGAYPPQPPQQPQQPQQPPSQPQPPPPSS